MGFLIKQLAKRGLKNTDEIIKAGKADWGNPLNIDGVEFVVKVGKGVIEFLF